MKTIRARVLSPVHGIFNGWEEWADVDYSVNPVGSEALYKIEGVSGGRAGEEWHYPECSPDMKKSFEALNGHRLQVEISKRVMKAAGQKPDDVPERPKSVAKKRPVVGHGTPQLGGIPDL